MPAPSLAPTIGLVLAIIVAVIAMAVLARRLDVPNPVVLAVGGLALGIVWERIPGVERIVLPPGIALFVFLPPLLGAAAVRLPFRAFRQHLRPIILLAIGLVLVTMVGAAGVAHWIDPSLTLPAAFVLGAIVAPPDPVAATSTSQRLGIRTRLVVTLEGEGLVNDATAIVAYHVAVRAAETGRFVWSSAAAEFALAVVVGIGVGLALGWLATLALRHLEAPTVETALTLVAPYAAYLIADELRGSGVLAVVTLGFFLGATLFAATSAPTRLTQRTVWSTVEFLVQGAVFVLVGMELGEALAGGVAMRLAVAGAVVSLTVIALRMGWMYVVPPLVRLLVGGTGGAPGAGRGRPATLRERTVLGWAGMRGVVSLALALAIPTATSSGARFPQRAEIIILTNFVILATLILQGLTLAPVVRATGVADPTASEREERLAREAAYRAAAAILAEYEQSGALPPAERGALRRWFDRVAQPDDGDDTTRGPALEARASLVAAEREVISRLRADGAISDDVASQLETELDVELVRLHWAASRGLRP
jgi:Na+/H+ antiporter